MNPSLLNTSLKSHALPPPISMKDFSVAILRDEVYKHVDQTLKNEVTKKVRCNWKAFTTIEKWKAYFDEHPEWHGKGTAGITKIEGGEAFYQAFSRWCRRKSMGNEEERKYLMEIVFPALYCNRYFTTIDEWKVYFYKHLEWHGKSTGQIQKIEGGYAFYQAFSKWCKKESKDDIKEKKRLIEIIFPPFYDRVFITIDEWKVYFEEHPEGHRTSTSGIRKMKSGRAFYKAFYKWCRRESKGNEEKRKCLMETIYPPLYNDWNLITIEEWKAYFEGYPEWHGKGTDGIKKIEGGYAFYQAFSKWCKKESKDDIKEKKRLIEIIFPNRGHKCSFRFKDGDICTFDSYPERLIGLLLHSLGMIKKFEEGKNLHIRTNGLKQHSVDFKVGDVFLEYHPIAIGEKRKGLNFDDAAKKKQDHITNPKYLYRTNLYVFDEIDTLYDIIQNDPELRFYIRYPYFGPDFGKKEWNILVSEVYQKVNEYDKTNPRKKK